MDAHFLIGDLFDPLRDLVSKDASLKPQYVYFLPPHETRPAYLDDGNERLIGVPEVSVFVPPEAHGDKFHFYRRMTVRHWIRSHFSLHGLSFARNPYLAPSCLRSLPSSLPPFPLIPYCTVHVCFCFCISFLLPFSFGGGVFF